MIDIMRNGITQRKKFERQIVDGLIVKVRDMCTPVRRPTLWIAKIEMTDRSSPSG